jgi:hypothetical protein
MFFAFSFFMIKIFKFKAKVFGSAASLILLFYTASCNQIGKLNVQQKPDY